MRGKLHGKTKFDNVKKRRNALREPSGEFKRKQRVYDQTPGKKYIERLSGNRIPNQSTQWHRSRNRKDNYLYLSDKKNHQLNNNILCGMMKDGGLFKTKNMSLENPQNTTPYIPFQN